MPFISFIQDHSITQTVALANIEMAGVVAVGGDWVSIITPFQIVPLSAIVAAAFVAVERPPSDHKPTVAISNTKICHEHSSKWQTAHRYL